jgi:hypothetical protein
MLMYSISGLNRCFTNTMTPISFFDRAKRESSSTSGAAFSFVGLFLHKTSQTHRDVTVFGECMNRPLDDPKRSPDRCLTQATPAKSTGTHNAPPITGEFCSVDERNVFKSPRRFCFSLREDN